MITYYEVQVWWKSATSKKNEIVYAKNLDKSQADSLLGRIINYQDWSELKDFIEKYEKGKISYIVEGIKRSSNTFIVPIIVSGERNEN